MVYNHLRTSGGLFRVKIHVSIAAVYYRHIRRDQFGRLRQKYGNGFSCFGNVPDKKCSQLSGAIEKLVESDFVIAVFDGNFFAKILVLQSVQPIFGYIFLHDHTSLSFAVG